MKFEEVTKGIFRLRVPFEKLYTSVFLVQDEARAYLVDCATTDADVDHCIRPALKEHGYDFDSLSALILTHRHGDHAGGLSRIRALAPTLPILSGGDARPLTEYLSLYPLAGHTRDLIGVYDARTSTLITGDGLQGEGVDRYPCTLEDRSCYIETLDRLEKDEGIKNLLFSHAYRPWNEDAAHGRAKVLLCIADCKRYEETLSLAGISQKELMP